MAIKVYQKRGNLNYKERRLIKEIEEAVEKKIASDPTLEGKFKSAASFEELQQLHNVYCAEDVAFEEIPDSSNKPIENPAPSVDDGATFDPFNKEEPIIRDYVMDEGVKRDSSSSSTEPKFEQTSFNEPVTFDESFKIPDDFDSDSKDPKKPQNDQKKKAQAEQQKNPTNPDFANLEKSRQNRSVKRFSKYLVETVCKLAEVGFVWWTTKNINEVKVAEYELGNEMDLSLILTLENGQEATVKQFFAKRCRDAEHLARIDAQEKADFAEALQDYLMQKNFAPTPGQDVALIAMKVLGEKAVNAFTMNMETNNLIAQLKEMKAQTIPHEIVKENPATPPPAPKAEPTSKATEAETPKQEVNEITPHETIE